MVVPIGFAQCNFSLDLDGDPEAMLYTVGVDLTNWTGGNQAAVEYIDATWKDVMDSLHSEDIQLSKTILYVGSDGPNLVFESTNAPVDGTFAASPLPQNCALLVRKLTAQAGRANRGRMYIPAALAESDVDQVGVIASGTVTARQTTINSFFSTLLVGNGDGTIGTVVLHSDSALAPTPITTYQVDNLIATQRRRLRR